MTTPPSDAPRPEPTDAAPAPVTDAVPVDAVPADAVPADAVPADAVPADAVPADAAPALATPAEATPAEVVAGAGDSATVVLAKAEVQETAPAAPAAPTVPAQATGPDPRVQAAAAPTVPVPTVPPQAWPREPATQPPASAPHPYAPPAAGVPGRPPHPYGQPYPAPLGGHPQPGGPVWALPAAYAPKQRKPRPWLRTVGRWTTAAAVTTVIGLVAAVLVTQPARTDIPGLKTPADGRYTFPALSLPTLPPSYGAPATGGVHEVDLRGLLLPNPVGATADAKLPGKGGWYPTTSFLGLLSSPDLVKTSFDDGGLRHIAATGWTMPDGTRTQIYLQQFRSGTSTGDVDTAETSAGSLVAAPDAQLDGSVHLISTIVGSNVRRQPAQGGKPSVLYGFFMVGDTEMLVVMSNPTAVPTIDFEQVVDLQDHLLEAT